MAEVEQAIEQQPATPRPSPWLEWLRDVFAHDYAEKLHMLRASTARGLGLDSTYVRPFPGTSTTINVQEPAQQQADGVGRTLWPTAIGAAIVAGGLGLGMLAALQGRGPSTVVVPQAGQAQPVNADAAARVRVYWGNRELTPDKPASAQAD